MASDWKSYDSAAGAHDRLRVPAMFAAPARDLAARMELESAGSLLDVGTGSGIVAAQANCPLVVGIDPSVEMVRLARENGISLVVAGSAPGLPFRDEQFDRVTASFVLSHVPSYAEALGDMVRVLRRGGRLGVTSWRSRRSEYHDCWNSAMERFVDSRAVNAEALPSEEWLAEPGNVLRALREAGLGGVEVEEREYRVEMTVESFLATRETSFQARYLRRTNPAGWQRFRETIAAEFHGRFRDPIVFSHRALIGTGGR